MECFNKLFARMLVFVYHCFDRVVINGYLSMLSRPENVVYFSRQVVGVPSVTQEVLRKRTDEYQRWVEAYALHQGIPIEWAEKGEAVRADRSVSGNPDFGGFSPGFPGRSLG